MDKVESRIGTVSASAEKIYDFTSDFNNFSAFIPKDKIQDWNASYDECSFSVMGLGKTGMKIIEKEPNKLVKISNKEDSSFSFFLWIQIKEVEENNSRIKITIQPQINPAMLMMVKKPLKNFVDMLVEQIEKFDFKA